MCISLSLCNFIYKSNCVYGIYRQVYTYIPIYMFKYVYVHIRVRQQLEYTLKLKKTRPFSLGWYWVDAGAGVPPFSPGS
jgi:hypothetical protein